MGSTCTTYREKSDKKVIIIGASFAGLSVAEHLWDHFDVMIVDRKDYFEYVCTNTRSFVDSEHFDNITIDLP